MTMATISLCMIVKNEQQVLARCLDSVRGAVDEIVIVDTGSTDSTREIALRYTDRVYDFLWIDDCSAARNFSFDQATMDYCMWLDADDVLTAEDRDGLIALKSSLLPETDVVMMKYNTAFDSAGRPTFSYYRERILRRGKFRWEGAVHEVIAPSGVILHSPLAVTHQKLHAAEPGRNLRIFEKLLAGGRVLTPREQFYYARELYYAGRYQEAAAAFASFLSQGRGWVVNNIDACRLLSACRSELGDADGALGALLQALRYGPPDAELCCDLGHWFRSRARYRDAIFWYALALGRKTDERTGAFVSVDSCGYLPAIWMCVCYDRLGEWENAEYYNELAGSFKPEDGTYLKNKSYFLNRKQTNRVPEDRLASTAQ